MLRQRLGVPEVDAAQQIALFAHRELLQNLLYVDVRHVQSRLRMTRGPNTSLRMQRALEYRGGEEGRTIMLGTEERRVKVGSTWDEDNYEVGIRVVHKTHMARGCIDL